jgi:uncharacterized protein YeaO (DUF488 family)
LPPSTKDILARMQRNNICTKSVYSPAEPADGRRVLTTHYWPRGIPKSAVDEYVRRLGPSRELLQGFKRGEISWDTYKDRYLQEMRKEEAKREIQRLANLAQRETVTILCVCKDESKCHRTLLRDLILEEASNAP